MQLMSNDNVILTKNQTLYVYSLHKPTCLPVWRDRVRRLAADQVVMRSSLATRHIRCALLANQPI